MKDKKPKMSRKEREQRMIAEMESALWEKKAQDTQQPETVVQEPKKTKKKEKNADGKGGETEQKLHCSRCGTLMEKGKCPNCGHYVYMPMDKAKQNKIRLAVGVVCVVGFVVLFVLLHMKS